MTLEEAIKHAEEVAEKNERRAESVRNRPISSADFYHEEESCSKCATEHRQLAEWLKDYKRLKEQEPKMEQFAKWVATEIFDDDWEYNKESFAELACRKLAKLGMVIRMGDEWELIEPQESEEKK